MTGTNLLTIPAPAAAVTVPAAELRDAGGVVMLDHCRVAVETDPTSGFGASCGQVCLVRGNCGLRRVLSRDSRCDLGFFGIGFRAHRTLIAS